MAHAFLNISDFNGDNNYYTQSAILRTKHYKPKVLIVGTYNDGNNIGNIADFFYGRNYFWPVLYNLANNFYQGNNQIISPRRHGLLNGIPNPNLTQILSLCELYKMTFADLIQDVLVELPNHDDKYINIAIQNNEVINNVKSIINFINENPTIECVYATTKFNNHQHIANLWETIKLGVDRNIDFGCIRTPSGRGGFNGPSASGIAKYWVWCNHPENPHGQMQNQLGYTHIKHDLLLNAGVDVNLF